MIEVRIICVGKLKESFYVDAVAEYAKRLRAYCKLEILELTEERLPERPSQAQIDAALEKESVRIFDKLSPGSTVIAMCVEGKSLSSEDLSAQIDRWAVQGQSRLALVLGGSFGLHPKVKQQAAMRLSMSAMTFPHHLARVMVLEQIYRAFKISEGSGYHK